MEETECFAFFLVKTSRRAAKLDMELIPSSVRPLIATRFIKFNYCYLYFDIAAAPSIKGLLSKAGKLVKLYTLWKLTKGVTSRRTIFFLVQTSIPGSLSLVCLSREAKEKKPGVEVPLVLLERRIKAKVKRRTSRNTAKLSELRS